MLCLVWFDRKCFSTIRYFQVKIFFRKEIIFKHLVAFLKILRKIFSSIWLQSWKCYGFFFFLLLSHIFSFSKHVYNKKDEILDKNIVMRDWQPLRAMVSHQRLGTLAGGGGWMANNGGWGVDKSWMRGKIIYGQWKRKLIFTITTFI